MGPPRDRESAHQAVQRLLELLDLPGDAVTVDFESPTHAPGRGADAVVGASGHTFVIEYKASGASAPVMAAARQARALASELGTNAVPIVAVPFMGKAGRARCEEAGIAWLDLSGNARIVLPGLRVVVSGQPNAFKRPGRPSNVFAPKSSRITRWLLMHPEVAVSQKELAEETEVDPGFTSRIVARLEQDELVVRDEAGAIRPRDPSALLDAWYERYAFEHHRIVPGHIPARDGPGLLRRIVDGLPPEETYAATGLAGAWLLTRFAAFRLVTIYLTRSPSAALRERLRFRESSSGPNVWFVVPDDEGVFQGAVDREGLRCVHPVQVYLDLKGHPERAGEAAAHLRAEVLNWSSHG